MLSQAKQSIKSQGIIVLVTLKDIMTISNFIINRNKRCLNSLLLGLTRKQHISVFFDKIL